MAGSPLHGGGWLSATWLLTPFILISGGVFVARITIDDCLKRVPNRFLLANMVARRVRQIREGSEYLVSSPKNADIVMSLREVAAGRIRLITEANDGD